MGVLLLTSFVSRLKEPKIWNDINIIEEITSWKKTSGKEPIIIFDTMGFIHNFGHRSHIEVNVGGRIHIYLAKFREFANQLKKAGAKLVFICDGHLRTDRVHEWSSRRNKEFPQTYAMITTGTDYKFKRSYGCKTFVTNLFKLIEDEKLGEIIVSTYAECDSIVASYAVKHDALAVIGDDSDILIYDGKFRWWQSTWLNIVNCTVRSYDRLKLHRYLNLSPTQMKYMATIAGNDHTKLNVLEYDSYYKIADTNFESVANFCRTLQGADESEVHSAIAKYMRKDKSIQQIHLQHIKNSIDSYNVFESTLMDRTEKFYQHSCLPFALKSEENIQIAANFLDYVERNRNSNQTFIDVIVNLYRRLAGIVLYERRAENPKVNIVTKYTLNGDYILKIHNPVYPDEKDLKDNTSLLLWSLDLDLDLREHNIPQTYYAIVLILTFLVEHRELSVKEADAILLAEYQINENQIDVANIPKPRKFVGDMIRIGQLFTRTSQLVWDCFEICDLSKLIHPIAYDGIYCCHLIERFRDARNNPSIKDIARFRIYDEYAV